MRSINRSVVALGINIACSSLMLGQVSGGDLRGKYEPGSSDQTLLVRPGIEMAVTYGPSDIVCKLVFSAGLTTQPQVDAVLDDVVPAAVRGKQVRHGGVSMGSTAVLFTDYEHANISLFIRSHQPEAPEPIQVTVTFKHDACNGH